MNRTTFADIILYIVLGLLAFVMIFPFYSVIVMSFSPTIPSLDIAGRFFPRSFDLTAYRFLFSGTLMLDGFRNTSYIVVLGVGINMFLTTTLAYGLSKKWLFGRNFLLNFIIFTMFFSGGLIPLFLLVSRTLNLHNSLFAVILPSGISTFYMIITKNFFQSLSGELEESAYIDGANDIQIFLRIMLPLSKPILATIALFYTVARWNEWFFPMLFWSRQGMTTVQLVLREMVIQTERLAADLTAAAMMQGNISMAVRTAATVVTVMPILFVYPFLQRYFVIGLNVGSVKE